MALQSSGTIKMSEINTELGRSSTATISLDSAENGTYATINTGSSSYPSSTNPASMSEWHGYDHSASSLTAIVISDSGAGDSNGACNEGPESGTMTVYTDVYPVTTNSILYSDSSGSTALDGGGQWYYYPSVSKTLEVGSTGRVDSVASC